MPTHRSAWAFAFGARIGVLMILTPSASNTASKEAVNLVSLSWIKYRGTAPSSCRSPLTFLALAALSLPTAWGSRVSWIRGARIGLVSAGKAFVLWLVYAELFVIRAICLWCTTMHVLTFVLFMLVVLFGWSPQSQVLDGANEEPTADL